MAGAITIAKLTRIGGDGTMMRTVRLEMARSHEFPEGSDKHGYEFHVPLTDAGKLDRDAIAKHRDQATFWRFWGGDDERGRVRHGHRGWLLAFARGTGEDEVIFKGDQHRFAPGEYVSIEERDGQTRTFRVVSVH